MTSRSRLLALLAAMTMAFSACTSLERIIIESDTIRYEASVDLTAAEVQAISGNDDAGWEQLKADIASRADDPQLIVEFFALEDASEADGISIEVVDDGEPTEGLRVSITDEAPIGLAVEFIAGTDGIMRDLTYTIGRDLISLAGDPGLRVEEILADAGIANVSIANVDPAAAGFEELAFRAIVDCQGTVVADETWAAGEPAPTWEMDRCDRIPSSVRNFGAIAAIIGFAVLAGGFLLSRRRSVVDGAEGR